MAEPGSIELQEIKNEDHLCRRVPFVDPSRIRDDGTPTSLAFMKKREDKGLSVNIARLSTIEKSIQNRRRFWIFEVNAGEVRSLCRECDCFMTLYRKITPMN